jgi:hypothetical protein
MYIGCNIVNCQHQNIFIIPKDRETLEDSEVVGNTSLSITGTGLWHQMLDLRAEENFGLQRCEALYFGKEHKQLNNIAGHL